MQPIYRHVNTQFTALTRLGVAVVVGDLLAALAATLPVDFTTRCTVTPSLIPTQTIDAQTY